MTCEGAREKGAKPREARAHVPSIGRRVARTTAAMPEPDLQRIEEEALRLLEVLCRQPSLSAESRALETTAALVEELLAGSGFETRQLRVEGGPPAVYGE